MRFCNTEAATTSASMGRAGGATRFALALALAVALALAATPALSSPRPSVVPRHGRPFVPVLGDWEGTVGGFPASFGLAFDPKLSAHGGRQYGFSSVVALRPNACPASSHRYSEDVITGGRLIGLGSFGTFALSGVGFAGSLTAAGSATLETEYHAGSGTGSCRGMLSWRMHPANRRVVPDGRWKLSFRDGELESFQVQAGGRLATSLRLPSELTRCSGATGSVDLFIGPDGLARITQPGVQMSIRFSGSSATGKINGRGCARQPFHFSARLTPRPPPVRSPPG